MNKSAQNQRQALNPADFGYSEFTPRIWHGMALSPWVKLLAGHFRHLSARRAGLAASVTLTAAINSGLSAISSGMPTSKAESPRNRRPVFVLGFWRSGTTYLHELLASIPGHAAPSMLQCMCPASFPAARSLSRLLARIIPSRRPMDRLTYHLDSPQEDEFAILNLGLETPYRYLAFPSSVTPERALEAILNPGDGVDPLGAEWQEFLERVAGDNPGKRLILKSPPHTARVEALQMLYPGARFVHILRDPYALFASNLKMTRAMLATQSFETRFASDEELGEGILDTFCGIYEAYLAARKSIPPGQLVEVKFEDLGKNPEATLGQIIDRLDLGDPGKAVQSLAPMLAERKGYSPDCYQLSDPLRTRICERWQPLYERLGYQYEW